MGRVIIIGLDGVPCDLLYHLATTDVLPNIRNVIDNGVLKPMQSTIPAVSAVAWSSIITGANPGEHRIFGFTDFSFDERELWFPDYDYLRGSPFWEYVPGSVIINVPSTYPVRPINGVHISGFVSIDLEKSVHPPSLVNILQSLDYRLDVNSSLAHLSMEAFLEDLDATLEARIKAASDLWDCNWPLFMLVFTGTDRLLHFLWDAGKDESHQYHGEFVKHFRKIDDFIGQILFDIGEDDILLLLSDHGFESLESEVYVNFILMQEGYLHFDSDLQKGIHPASDVVGLAMEDMSDSTTALSLDPGRIYVPRSLEHSVREDILSSLTELFESLTFEDRPVIKNVHNALDVYTGPFISSGPDLVLEPAQGFDLKSTLMADGVFGKRLFTGKHTRHNAFLLVNSPNVDIPENPTVFDIADIVRGGLDGNQA